MQCLEQRRDELLGGQPEAAQGADPGDAVGVLHSGPDDMFQAYDETRLWSRSSQKRIGNQVPPTAINGPLLTLVPLRRTVLLLRV